MRTNVLNDLSNVVKKGTGLACSWSQVGRMSEGAPDEHPMSIRSASDGERWKPAGEKGSTRVWKHVAMIFAVLVMSMANVGTAWGGTPVTWTANSSDVSTLVGKSKVTVGSGTKTFDVWAVRAIVDASNTPAISYDGGVKFGDNALNKSGVAIYIPSTSDNIESIEFYLKTSNSRKTYYASGSSCPSSGTATGSALATSFTAYDFWSGGSYSKNYYYAIGGKTSGSGEVYIQKIVVTFADAAPSTKRIYMKAGEWNNDSPYFYAHSWGSSNSDVLMTLADCETDVYYADIPSSNTSVLFTRQSTNSGIKYKDQDGNWNQSADITISTNNKFTFSAWNGGDGKSTFTGGTYSAPTYTISFAANGGSGSMSSISSIACGDDQALPANTFTKSGYVFDGWKADVAVTIGGSSVAAGTKFAGGSTLQNITSNITLTAQWEENSCPESGTVYSASTSATGDISIAASASNLALNTATHKTTVTGGTMSVYNGQSSAKNLITANGFAMTNNNTYFRIDLDCPLETGDVISVDVGKNAEERGVWITTATSRPNSAPACALTATGTGSALATVTYTVTGSDAYHGNSTFYIYRATGNGTNFNNINITRSSACGATQPGEIGKGLLSNCSITLTAANSPAANNTWYWQSASDGTATNLGSGATKSVSTPGTYYIRSYFSTGSCWSDARSVTVTEGDLTPAAPTSLTAASTTAKGTTFTVTGAGTSNFEFYVSTESTAPVAGTGATYSAASTTKTIDDKVAGTTYYAWVRAVCGSYKSGWTALTGNTFTTSQVTVTHTLTNVTATSGATGANAAGGSDYTAVFAAVSGYSLPAPAITIDGNAAESGTDYTWTQGTGTVVIPANKITGNIVITIASAAAAPTNVAISGAYHYYPGETISLTATATGGNGPKTYQWYHGGTADGNAIDGATSATFTKSNCVVGDAGSYYCKVTCGGSASTWSDGAGHDPYNVKIMQFVLKNNSSVEISRTALTKVDATHATVILHLTGGTTYKFRITDGCGNYFGNTGTMTNGNSTDWYMNADADCGMTTGLKTSNYTFNVTLGDLGNGMQVTAIYPGGDQEAGKIIYWDNSVLNWADGAQWYRIGKSTHHNKIQMTKVSGTANLYKVTTIEYNGFEYWHIADNQGNGDGNLFWTKGDAAKAITNAMEFEGAPVTLDAITVTPTNSHETGVTSDNDNCEFYTHTTVSGMKRDRVTITAPVNGTITVVYDDVAGDEQSFTSGNRDLAHTVILKSVTAAPATGYDLSSLTINGNTHTSGNSYTCSGATTIAASFSLHNYNVTYSNPGNGNNYTIKVASGSASSESKTANMDQTITLVASPAAGYDFTGWTISKAGGGTVEPVNASATTTTFTMPTDDVTITASFTLKTYTVNFAASPAGYGSVSPTSIASVNHGSTVSIASNVLTLKGTNVTATPTAAGADYTYAFSGWSVSNGAAITEAQTITANFTRTANQYSVTHSLTNMTTGSGATGANAATYGTDYTATLNANSGYSRPASITVTAGATDITANCTWNQSTGAVTIPGSYITGNITITAAAVLVYTVTFNSNGGSAVSPISQASTGASITMPAAPTYADHTFQGWVIGGNTYAAGASYTPTANVTAYALWRADCAGGGGGGGSATWSYYFVDPDAATDVDVSNASSVFTSMPSSTSTAGSAMSYTIGGKTLSSAKWKYNNAVTNGSTFTTFVVPSGYTATEIQLAVNPGGSGLNVKVYNSSDEEVGSSGSVTNSDGAKATITNELSAGTYTIKATGRNCGRFYAIAAELTSTGGGTCYYVTYDGNGAESGSISDPTAYAEGDDVTVLGNTGGNAFVKAGYEFTGWNTAANGSGDPYSAGGTISGISGDVTLYAQWGAPCSDPDAPTGLAVGSITSSGATFTITDAANTNNYEIVCKTTSGTPAADATPTQTGTSKTIAVTGLDAYTDYYAYVRSVCNASHKSSWVALTGAPFKTLCEDPTTAFANGDYTIGGSALDLRTLISGNNSSGAITYSVTNAGGTGATIAGDGYSFSATIPGTAYVRASQAANGGHCAAVLDATVTVAAANTCVTITNFETTKHNKSNNNKPDGQNYYLYGYKTTVDSEHAVTLTTTSSNNYGQSSGTVIRVDNSSTLRIYANNATSETPTTFSDVTSVSFKADLYNSGSTVRTTSYTIKVGSTTVGSGEITGKHSDGFFEISTGTFATKDGYIDIILGSGNSNNNLYIDDIEICTSALTPCTTPTIPTLSNQTVCPGSDIAAWNATVSNAAAISAAGESVAYSWKKKGSDTELVNTASLDLGSSATEGQSGTYVVTVTVSADGKASTSASREVTLTVIPATEEPAVTQSPAKVYVSDDVTLTATCGSAGTITWAWYTCNSDGTGELVIAGKTTATCAITAPAVAGTYYYKVKATGDGTNACGTAEHIHALVVTAASECENYFWFTYADDATTNGVINNRSSFFTGAPTGSSNQGSYKFTVDGTEYTATRNTGSSSISISFTVPEGSTADFVMNGKSSSSNAVTLTLAGGTPSYNICASGSYAAYSQTGLTAGTWTLTAGSNWTLAALAVHVCHTSSCTDAVPEIAAVNNTVCSGTELSITATGYEDGATFQWQKLNSGTSSWDNISGATNATYTVATAAAEHAGSYRLVATKGCARTSNTVTIAVPSVPVFGAVPSSVTVMQTIALSITTVEASDAVKYRWYKSADATWDAGDAEICDTKNLLKPYDGEAVGNNAYYVFCRAQNACGIATSSAIAVNVTAYVEEDCATRGNEGEAHFGFDDGGCGQTSYSETACWTTSTRAKYLTYTAPEGKYLKTAKVTVAVSSGSKCGYAYSTDGGTTWTYAELTSLSSTLTEKTINLNSLSGTINAFRIGRNLQDGSSKDWGVTSGNFYLSKACFEYTNACTATTVTVSPTSKTYTIGNSWTAPTITLGPVAVASETLTYTSSDEDIATVDDDGTVNFQGRAGSVTITASYAGGEVGLTDYCASEGSYTITVSCSGDAPKIVAASTVDLSGCNSSVVLNAKEQDGTTDFTGGSYQWFRNGEEIDGATNKSYTATQAGIYTVEYASAGGCTSVSTNSAVVTSTTTEPEVERLVPFQYYHVNKVYAESSIMRFRHLFAVKNSGTLDGKHFKMYVSRNGDAATDVTSSNALVVVPNGDGHVDTVMVDLNKLSGKYSENDELVYTCKAIDCEGNISNIYTSTVTMHVIGSTPTMALILNGKGSVVGGDFLEDYEPKNLQEQTGSKTWGGEWPMYTDLKTEFSVTPVNGYAPFNKLNYEPFDIIFLTDFPKASKSDAAATILDDMYELVDFRPMFSFKTHMVHKSPSKWALKGFTTSPTENKGDGRTYLNIVCYAHPMFEDIKTGDEVYTDASDGSELVYKMLSGTGYENSKGMQGFEIDAAENFVTIGLTHYNASVATAAGVATWTPDDGDRMLVSSAERQANPEARMILLSLNAGAHSKLTAKGRAVVMKSLEYLIQTSGGLIEPADCSYTFDNAAGDHNWSTAGNWGPRHNAVPGPFTSTRIAAAAVVDIAHAHAMEVRIVEGGSIEIPAGKGLEVKSTVRHMDGAEISPTEVAELSIGSASSGNGTLIFNNKTGDTKAGVAMYSKGYIDGSGNKNYQYMGVPCVNINAAYNYYGSWIYSWSDKGGGSYGWKKVVNGGIVTTWTGYCITQESAGTYYAISGTLAATGTVDIDVPAGENMVVGNSWTAPIDINAFTDDDFENLEGNVYFFNVGIDKDKEHDTYATSDRYAGGTYVTVPIHAAPYTDDDHIPSLQGFFVKSPEEATADGVLHLDYDRHVRGTTRANILSGEMHAPRRANAQSDEPAVLKIKVSGENYDDKLLLLAREDFSMGFDNGWDGDKWDGNESALYIYTKDEEGTENSVSAIPEMEGTVIGFRAGEDDAYTLHFEYLNSAEELYLFDTETNAYTKIMTGATYRFFTDDKEKHDRFVITRKSPQIATDVDEVDSGKRREVRKLLIEDKMYILVNGMLYDATGKVVK